MEKVSEAGATVRLLTRCAEGRATEAEWNGFVERASPKLRSAVLGALALCHEPAEPALVEDLVQEVWCRLLADDRRILGRFRESGDGAAIVYLRRVASAITIDLIRARRAAKRRPARSVPLDATGESGLSVADRSVCPERRLLAGERLAELLRLCRERLGRGASRARVRAARLGIVEGWSSSEIAEHLGGSWTVSAIDSMLFRLRRRLERDGIRLPRRPGGVAGARRASPLARLDA